MPSQKNISLAHHIQSLEKSVLKIKQQLTKAHAAKINKLEKQLGSTTIKLKKAKEKRRVLVTKKTTATQQRRRSLDLSISTLDSDRKALKEQLNQARHDFKGTKEIERAILKTKTDIVKNKKKQTVLKKKAVKKALKKVKDTTPLTPDLSIPVSTNKITKKSKKNWIPKTKKKEKKMPKDELLDKQQAFPFPATKKKTTPATPTQENKSEIRNNSNKQALKSSPSKAEKNWHTMPLLREQED